MFLLLSRVGLLLIHIVRIFLMIYMFHRIELNWFFDRTVALEMVSDLPIIDLSYDTIKDGELRYWTPRADRSFALFMCSIVAVGSGRAFESSLTVDLPFNSESSWNSSGRLSGENWTRERCIISPSWNYFARNTMRARIPDKLTCREDSQSIFRAFVRHPCRILFFHHSWEIRKRDPGNSSAMKVNGIWVLPKCLTLTLKTDVSA